MLMKSTSITIGNMSLKRDFLWAGLVTAVINLVLHAGAYFGFLKNYFATHPAGSKEYLEQLNRPPEELVIWSLLVYSLAFGFFITLVIHWSGARTFSMGLKHGFILSFLFWTAINFGLYSAQNIFSLAAVFADLGCSILAMTTAAGVSAWMLGKDQAKIHS